MITGIIVALPEELSTLTSKKLALGESGFISDNILVALSGAGPENASNATQMLIDKGSCKIISWGCAAALDANLDAGDLCLPQLLIAESQQQFNTHLEWQQHSFKLLSGLQAVCCEPVVESTAIISTSTHKKMLYKNFGGAALDMESVSIAKTAQKNYIPVLVVRAIADTADMDLPEAINIAMTNQGRINIKKLIVHLIAHPMQISGLIRLGRHFSSARRKLKAVANVLDEITSFTISKHSQLSL